MSGPMRGWQSLLAAAEAPLSELCAAINDPEGAQTRRLLALVARNNQTAFGRRHGFDRIRSPTPPL